MFPDHLLIGRAIDTVNLVPRHETLDPLNFNPEFAQHTARCLRNLFELPRVQFPCTGDLTLNDILWHPYPPSSWLKILFCEKTEHFPAPLSRLRSSVYFTVTLNLIQG